MAGRPTKFTEETVDKILSAIKMGSTYAGACRYAGITNETLCAWRNGRFPRSASKELRIAFSEGLTRAEGEAEIQALAAIKMAARSGDWRAAAWWLERRHREEYGKQIVEVSGRDGMPIEIRTMADRIAEADGLNVDDILAEATALLGGAD